MTSVWQWRKQLWLSPRLYLKFMAFEPSAQTNFFKKGKDQTMTKYKYRSKDRQTFTHLIIPS